MSHRRFGTNFPSVSEAKFALPKERKLSKKQKRKERRTASQLQRTATSEIPERLRGPTPTPMEKRAIAESLDLREKWLKSFATKGHDKQVRLGFAAPRVQGWQGPLRASPGSGGFWHPEGGGSHRRPPERGSGKYPLPFLSRTEMAALQDLASRNADAGILAAAKVRELPDGRFYLGVLSTEEAREVRDRAETSARAFLLGCKSDTLADKLGLFVDGIA